MKLALECPTNMLADVQPLADFDWILAHLALEGETYANHYIQSNRFKVLDNSVNELLEPLSLGELVKADKLVGANLIVAPDYLGSLKKTWEALVEALKVFGLERVMPVVQGTNLDEIVEFTGFLVGCNFSRVAVPYDILSKREEDSTVMANNRLRVVNSIINRVPIGFGIHLLGMTTIEELSSYSSGWVRSIDTGVPVLLGMKGYAIDKSPVDKSKPTMDQMEAITSVDPEYSKQMIYYNIAYLRRLIGNS